MSLFFMRLIESMKKNGVVARNHARLSRSVVLSIAVAKALVSATACVNGKNTFDNVCTSTGRSVNGKNVPLKMNIGVMKRKLG